MIFADFEPLRHVHVHVVPSGGVVVHLHGESVRHVPREVKLGHQVLAGLDAKQQQGTVGRGEKKRRGVEHKKRARSSIKRELTQCCLLLWQAVSPPLRRSTAVAEMHQWQTLPSQSLRVRRGPKKLVGGKIDRIRRPTEYWGFAEQDHDSFGWRVSGRGTLSELVEFPCGAVGTQGSSFSMCGGMPCCLSGTRAPLHCWVSMTWHAPPRRRRRFYLVQVDGALEEGEESPAVLHGVVRFAPLEVVHHAEAARQLVGETSGGRI